ncbi:MAG: hypothetical protein ACYTDT_07485 [Planctomycetota bacterium]|jgi:hypothetical protein
MLSPEMVLNACLDEIKVIKHLATKVPVGGLRYKPTDGQRTMDELMQYLTVCGSLAAKGSINGNWDHAEAYSSRSKEVTQDNFAARMDEQAADLTDMLKSVPSGDWQGKDATFPWGQPVKLGDALLMTALKSLTAYRMQFFLYLKSAGRTDLGSAQCWVGFDPQPAPASAE